MQRTAMKAEVTSATGTTVRKGSELSSEKIDHLPLSTILHLSGQQKMEYDKGLIEKQVHITFPYVGWVSDSHVKARAVLNASSIGSMPLTSQLNLVTSSSTPEYHSANAHPGTPQMQPKLNFCVSCGVSLRSDVGLFCSNCGAAIRSNTASTPSTPSPYGAHSSTSTSKQPHVVSPAVQPPPPMYTATETPQARSTRVPVNAAASADKWGALHRSHERCVKHITYII